MAMKTGEEIEYDLYRWVKSHLAVRGEVYLSGKRPFDRGREEDCVVSFLSGRDGQTQRGVVIVSVYVPDIPQPRSPHLSKNRERCTNIARQLLDLVIKYKTGGYWLQTEETVRTEEDKECHIVTLRIKYRHNAL